MISRLLLLLLLTLYLVTPTSGQPLGFPPATAPQLPELQHFNLRLFEIPYDWTGGGRPSGTTAVKLYVSSDQGTSWQEISSARHDVQYFQFHAPADGEYWFAIRTIDGTGRARPEGPLAPEQRMLVDTRNPEITRLDAVRTSPTQVDLYWEAVDTHLDPASLVAELRTQNSDWKPMQSLGAMPSAPGVVAGQATCEVDPATQAAWVRVTVRDLAGNGRQAGAEVRAADAASSTPGRVVSGPHPDSVAPSAPTQPARGMAPQVQWGAVGVLPQQRPQSQLWPSDGATSTPLGPRPAPSYPSAHGGTVTSSPVASQPAASYPVAPEAPAGNPPPRQEVPSRLTSSQMAPGLGISAGGVPGGETGLASPQGPHSLAPSAVPSAPLPVDQYLNRLQLDFDYNIESLGEVSIARVELWGTTDDGAHWQRLAIDNDNRSPIQVQLPHPGRYGLRIIVQPVGGFEPITPQPGDKPEMTIVVDTQPPLARMTSIQQGLGFHADHLLVRWEATDAHLRSQSAILRYGPRPDGPWQVVASDLQSNGEYAWRLGRHVPTEFYLQLEVSDEAGNRTIDTTKVPVRVTFPEASGHLQQARPTGR